MASHHKLPTLRLYQRSIELPINTEDFTLEELNACLELLTRNKTPGPDNINAEIWKTKPLSEELSIYATKFTMETPQISGAKAKLYQYQRRETFGKQSTSKGI